MENKYYIAVEIKPNNYFPINLKELSIAKGFNSYDIEELDSFTLNYTEEEIKNAIIEDNLLTIDNSMSLVVIYYEKNVIRKTDVLTKDKLYDLNKYIKDNFNNKVFINKIYNFLNNKVSEDLDILKNPLNIEEYMRVIDKLSYVVRRKLYFYLNGK